MTNTGVVLMSILLLSGVASAAPPLRIKNGSPVRMMLNGKREVGVGVKSKSALAMWQLELSLPGPRPRLTAQGRASLATAGQVELVDITAGANQTRWEVTPVGTRVTLDDRFIAGHAYRVTFKRGPSAVISTLVYLYPPPAPKASRIGFNDADSRHDGGDDELAISKKSSL